MKVSDIEHKQMAQKAIKTNPTSVPYEDCWNLDYTLANIIAEHLRSFLHWETYHPDSGIPGNIYQKYNEDDERASYEWKKILGKMIYSFEKYFEWKNLCSRDDESYDELRKRKAQMESRIREGMMLFVEYYTYLRI